MKRPPQPQALLPIFSYQSKNIVPGDLTRLQITAEQAELLERQSLEIFTLMSNAGYPLAKALGAILLTGINWGVNAS